MVLQVFLGSAGSTPPAWGWSQPQVLRWPLFFIFLLPDVFIFSDYHITTTSFLSTLSIATILGWSTITCSPGCIWKFCRISAVIFLLWTQSFQSKLGKDVAGRHLVVMHHGCFTYEHHTACGCYVLGCLRGFFSQHTSYVVWQIPASFASCAHSLLSCCHDRGLLAVFQSSCFQPLYDFLISSISSICRGYMPCRGFSSCDRSTASSTSGFQPPEVFT